MDPVFNAVRAVFDPQQFNRYAYALNNPLRFVDPLELVTCENSFSQVGAVFRVTIDCSLDDGDYAFFNQSRSQINHIAGDVSDTAGPLVPYLGMAVATNMMRAGVLRALETDAHHIVAGSARAAAPARVALERVGIGLDDAANGVFLPRPYHARVHTAAYYEVLNDRLADVATRDEALAALDRLRAELLTGRIRW